jgi:hypothetical protein
LEPHSDPVTTSLVHSTPALIETAAIAAPADPAEQTEANENVIIPEISPVTAWWHGSGTEIVRATRSWIQYGTVAFAVICIIIGAVEALLGR